MKERRQHKYIYMIDDTEKIQRLANKLGNAKSFESIKCYIGMAGRSKWIETKSRNKKEN